MKNPKAVATVESSKEGYDRNAPQVRVTLRDGSIIILDMGARYDAEGV